MVGPLLRSGWPRVVRGQGITGNTQAGIAPRVHFLKTPTSRTSLCEHTRGCWEPAPNDRMLPLCHICARVASRRGRHPTASNR